MLACAPKCYLLFHNHHGPSERSSKIEQKDRKTNSDLNRWYCLNPRVKTSKGGREGQLTAATDSIEPAITTIGCHESDPQELGIYLPSGVQGKSHIQAYNMDGVFNEALNLRS